MSDSRETTAGRLNRSEPDPGTEAMTSRGFRPFRLAHSKGYDFQIWLRPPTSDGRFSWKAAVLSRGTADYATAYVSDGVLRASVPISDPRGHLLFRADTDNAIPVPDRGFQVKFGLT